MQMMDDGCCRHFGCQCNMERKDIRWNSHGYYKASLGFTKVSRSLPVQLPALSSAKALKVLAIKVY